MTQKIILQKQDLPTSRRIDDDIEWLCDGLGLISGRDTEKNAMHIFKEVILQTARKGDVTSTSLAADDLTQSNVNHHLRFLINTGIVERRRRIIVLRGGSMKQAVLEIRRDANRIFEDLLVVAEQIDKKTGLKSRQQP